MNMQQLKELIAKLGAVSIGNQFVIGVDDSNPAAIRILGCGSYGWDINNKGNLNKMRKFNVKAHVNKFQRGDSSGSSNYYFDRARREPLYIIDTIDDHSFPGESRKNRSIEVFEKDRVGIMKNIIEEYKDMIKDAVAITYQCYGPLTPEEYKTKILELLGV